jgi:glyceraldehyde-3-phosphate dehydrogenase (NADP+)
MRKDPLLYVDGQWLATGQTFEVLDPSDARVLARVPLGDARLLEAATRAAHAAFTRHRHATAAVRSDWLRALAAAIEARAEDFAHAIQQEAGKPIKLARLEVGRALATFTLAAGEARQPQGSMLALDALPNGAAHHGIMRRFPLGVIAAITPFNFPLNLVAHKVAPALASGNSVIVKPSPRTPLTALLLAEAAETAGIPPGLLNVVTCANSEINEWLADQRVRMLSFTGSGSVGKSLHAVCAGKRCTLELGGNAPVLVHADARVSEAIPLIASAAFSYAGQSCISVQRVLVEESRYAEVKESLVDYTRTRIRSGPPSDPEADLGPMIDEAAAQRALGLIESAVQGGAQLLCGGGRRRAFLEPTILEGARATDAVVCEEAFAPVLCLEKYRSFEEAVERVNTSAYGLQAGVFTNDFQLAWKSFQEFEMGAVLINQVPTWRTENMPYGGVKNSGLGREGVREAMEEMTEPRCWIWRQPGS